MVDCDECDSKVTETDSYCPYCGAAVCITPSTITTKRTYTAAKPVFYSAILTTIGILTIFGIVAGISLPAYALLLPLGTAIGLFLTVRADNIRRHEGIFPTREQLRNRNASDTNAFVERTVETANQKTKWIYMQEVVAIAVLFVLAYVLIVIPLDRLGQGVLVTEISPVSAVDMELYDDFVNFFGQLSTLLISVVATAWLFYVIFTPLVVVFSKIKR